MGSKNFSAGTAMIGVKARDESWGLRGSFGSWMMSLVMLMCLSLACLMIFRWKFWLGWGRDNGLDLVMDGMCCVCADEAVW